MAAASPLPAYQSDGAAGMDLLAAVPSATPLRLAPGARALVPTGLVLELPQGFEAQVRPRSGLALRHGVTVLNSPGTIDCDYRGEVQVLLVNLGDEPFAIRAASASPSSSCSASSARGSSRSQRIAATPRGAGGFGSTGTRASAKPPDRVPRPASRARRSAHAERRHLREGGDPPSSLVSPHEPQSAGVGACLRAGGASSTRRGHDVALHYGPLILVLSVTPRNVIRLPHAERPFAASDPSADKKSRTQTTCARSRKGITLCASCQLHPSRRRPLRRSALPAGQRSPTRALRVSGPHVHENLAVYFVHGASAGGAVPLTLQEALAKGSVQVIETGRVNELQIENTGAEQVFIQAGDIVKGGKQDRVLTVSFLLPAKSGRVPIASFCVEQGRWSARGKEDLAKFSSAQRGDAVAVRRCWRWRPRRPSRARPATAAAAPTSSATRRRVAREPDEVADKQSKVWDSVASTQNKLAQRPQCAGGIAAVGLEPAAVAGEREAEGGARRLSQGAASRPARRRPTSSAMSSPSTAR